MDIVPLNGVAPELAAALTSALVPKIRQNATDYSVLGSDEIRTLLTMERQKQQLGCSQVSCLAEIGGALGAAQMVSGTLGKFGTTQLLQVKLVDVRKARVIREASERIQGTDDARLLNAVAHVARVLFAPEGEEPPPPVFEEDVSQSGAGGGLKAPSALADVLGGVAVVGIALGIVGILQVSNYQSDQSAAQIGVTTATVIAQTSGYKNATALTNEYNQAKNVWQPLAVAGFIGAALALGGAVIAW